MLKPEMQNSIMQGADPCPRLQKLAQNNSTYHRAGEQPVHQTNMGLVPEWIDQSGLAVF